MGPYGSMLVWTKACFWLYLLMDDFGGISKKWSYVLIYVSQIVIKIFMTISGAYFHESGKSNQLLPCKRSTGLKIAWMVNHNFSIIFKHLVWLFCLGNLLDGAHWLNGVDLLKKYINNRKTCTCTCQPDHNFKHHSGPHLKWPLYWLLGSNTRGSIFKMVLRQNFVLETSFQIDYFCNC